METTEIEKLILKVAPVLDELKPKKNRRRNQESRD